MKSKFTYTILFTIAVFICGVFMNAFSNGQDDPQKPEFKPEKTFNPIDLQKLIDKGKLKAKKDLSKLSLEEKLKEKISVDLRGQKLFDSAAILTTFLKTPILIDPGVMRPFDLKEKNIDFRVNNVSFDKALTYLCRMLDSEYRIRDNSICISQDYKWLGEEKLEVGLVDVLGLYHDSKGKDILNVFMETCKLPMWFNADIKIKFMPKNGKVFLSLPQKELENAKHIAIELQKAYPEKPPYELDIDLIIDSKETKSFPELEKKFREETFDLSWDGYPRNDLLLKIGEEKDINIVFCSKIFKNNYKTSFADGKIKLPKAILRLIERQNKLAFYFEDTNIVWIGEKNRYYPPTANNIRDTAIPKVYPVKKLANMIGHENIIDYIKKNSPDMCWKMPGTSIVYHPFSKKLIVIHRQEIHDLIDKNLNKLAALDYRSYLIKMEKDEKSEQQE